MIYRALSKRKLTIFCVLLIFIAGIICFEAVPKQEYPVVEMPIDIVTVIYPGASATDMEELVAGKIEDEIMKVTGVDYCETECYNNVCVVKVLFQFDLADGVYEKSCNEIRNNIEDIRSSQLPSGVSDIRFNTKAAEASGIIYAFTGENKSNEEFVQRANQLKKQIESIKGINHVVVEGEVGKKISVTVDMEKLKYTNLNLSDIVKVLAAQNATIPLGKLEFKSDKIIVNSSGALKSIDEIENIIVGGSEQTGAAIRLKDIAKIECVNEEDAKHYYFNGQDVVLVNVYFDEGINILSLGEEVRKVVDQYQQTLPQSIQLNEMVFSPDDVEGSVNNFLVNLVESVVIVLVIVMIGMSIRNGFIVSVVIPLTIFITFIGMKLLKIDVQFISLASLIVALGMLVDNAIVVSDAIQALYDQGEDKMKACLKGTKEVSLPVLASTLTTVFIFCAFYMLPGTMLQFTSSLPTIVIMALMASYVVSMLVTPVMCFYLMKPSKIKEKTHKGILEGFFEKLLQLALKFRVLTMIIAIAAVVGGARLFVSIESSMMPFSEKMYLDIDLQTSNMNDMRQTEEVVQKAQAILKGEKEVKRYMASVGGRIPKYDFCSMPVIDSSNRGCIVARVDLNQGGRFTSKSAYKEYMQELLSQKIPGVRIVVKELDVRPNASEKIQVRVVGDDYETLNEVATAIEGELKKLEGSTNVYNSLQRESYNYYIEMKNSQMNRLGLTKSEIQNEINIALMGREATIFRKDSKEYPIKVKSNITDQQGLESLTVQSSRGQKGRYEVKQMADIKLKEDYTCRMRYNGQRDVIITGDAKTGYSTVTLENLLREKIQELDLKGTKIIYEGDLQRSEEVNEGLRKGGVLGLLAIFLVLFAQFNSYKQCFNVLASIPFGIIGAAIGLKLTGQTRSMFALLGVISLMGVVVNNAIILIDYINSERQAGKSIDEACKTAVGRRFRPILLSTTTTVLGLIPLAVGGNPLFTGMAIAFMCGLTSSLIFTLVVIPTIYSLTNKEKLQSERIQLPV